MAWTTPSNAPHRFPSSDATRFLHCDVELVDLDRRRKFAGCTVCERKAPTEAGEGYLGSFLLGEARRTESERVISQHSGDQNALAFEYPHGSTVALVGD